MECHGPVRCQVGEIEGRKSVAVVFRTRGLGCVPSLETADRFPRTPLHMQLLVSFMCKCGTIQNHIVKQIIKSEPFPLNPNLKTEAQTDKCETTKRACEVLISPSEKPPHPCYAPVMTKVDPGYTRMPHLGDCNSLTLQAQNFPMQTSLRMQGSDLTLVWETCLKEFSVFGLEDAYNSRTCRTQHSR